VDERLITGTGADPYERFLAWADTMPRLIGNPLYHWTHLELQRYFDIHEPLNRESAPAVWKAANERIKNDPEFSVYGIFKKFKVYAVGTTDDPADNLEWHQKAAGAAATRILPSFRPDKALAIDKAGFAEYAAGLGKSAGKTVSTLDDLLESLSSRAAFFDSLGCRASDHGLDYVPFEAALGASVEKEAAAVFAKVLAGGIAEPREAELYKTFVLSFLAGEYFRRGWVMQLHTAALRSNNTGMFKSVGPDTGFDAINDYPVSAKLARFLDSLNTAGTLPRTVLYSLNFKDFYPMATIMGCFQGPSGTEQAAAGKMQLGSAWWFLDHRDGMEDQMKLLANTGLLSRFIGMLTDSRSFLSYPRHEYFRRILCNIIGTWAENGEIPGDFALLSGLVKDVSFGNAKRYFEN
jgi:glucuronate isomerase